MSRMKPDTLVLNLWLVLCFVWAGITREKRFLAQGVLLPWRCAACSAGIHFVFFGAIDS